MCISVSIVSLSHVPFSLNPSHYTVPLFFISIFWLKEIRNNKTKSKIKILNSKAPRNPELYQQSAEEFSSHNVCLVFLNQSYLLNFFIMIIIEERDKLQS